MKQYKWKNKEPIMAHEILYSVTSEDWYDMTRLILLERNLKYVAIEGWHCSCYDFDECTWEATEFENKEELMEFLNLEDFEGLRKKAFRFMEFYFGKND